MVRKSLVTAVTAAALAVPAPAAVADHAIVECEAGVIGLYGYVLSPTPGEWVSIRCYVETWALSTPTATGVQFAFTSAPIVVPPGAVICAEWSAGNESGTRCDGAPRRS